VKRLKARLGDVLMKEWTLVGITSIVIAVTALGQAEKGVKASEEVMTFPERRFVLMLPLSLLRFLFIRCLLLECLTKCIRIQAKY
jgi:hypothetical protein